MQNLCENCKFWIETERMQNWGTCTKNGSGTCSSHRTMSKAVTGILRRCHENCWDFEAKHKNRREQR